MVDAERKIIITPGGTEIDISTMERSIQPFVENVYQMTTPEFSTTEFGHATMALAVAAIGSNSNGDSPEAQLAYHKRCAIKMIEDFGPNIIPLLRDELQAAITEEDIADLYK